MLRCVVVFFVALAAANAAIWPDNLGQYTRRSTGPAGNSGVDGEYGFEAAETADYGPFQVTALRFKDSTGAYAASLEKPGLQVGNYVVTCRGKCPKDLPKLAESLPRVSKAPLPSLHIYFPAKDLQLRSQRYILGPLSLKEFAPQLPPSVVAFQFGPEGQVAHYRTPQGDQTLAVFSYPTPQIARQQTTEFQKLPGAVVRRSGPIVGIVTGPEEAATAERLLSQVTFRASVSWDEPPPVRIKPQTVGKMMISIFVLTGVVLVFCVLSGLVFGGFRMLRYRLGPKDAQEPMILLHLGDK